MSFDVKYRTLQTEDVSEADLNDIDNQNGEGALDYKLLRPEAMGKNMKGALAPYKLPKKDFGNGFNDNNEFFGGNTEINFFWTTFNSLLNASTEVIRYENLPPELDKYMIEYLLMRNGVIGLIKLDVWEVVPVEIMNAPLPKKYSGNFLGNYGYLPSKVKIMRDLELGRLNELKEKEFTVGENIWLIRNDLNRQSDMYKIGRYLVDFENTLFALEQNIRASQPKFALIGEYAQSSEMVDAFQSFLTGAYSVYQLNYDANKLSAIMRDGIKFPIMKLEVDDKTESLRQSLTFLLEKIKQQLGLENTSTQDKKERTITDEMSASNSLSQAYLEHKINIRNTDLARLNRATGLNIRVVRNQEIKLQPQGVENDKTQPE